MPILSNSKKNKREKVSIGVLTDADDASLLTLYSKAFGISKTSIISDLIKEWIKNKFTKEFVSKLCNRAATRSYAIWVQGLSKHKRGRKKYKDFDSFCEALHEEFLDKGISLPQADAIINKVKKLNNG